MRPQLASLEHGAHIVVGTPGRIMDHLERGSLAWRR
jgi:ATP-independent RNA helicase DbpA